ncbi:hypothetical protein LTS14_002656 [Recurvomyces mirabilis]|uniref:uncharacterized protein n=1 Tax=Recurvomyces mirabilis TaxID=574656 RepID=UPI002DE09FB7|nr:hypothetical protein LTS14_002656 [Recurvomyces mirabilis]
MVRLLVHDRYDAELAEEGLPRMKHPSVCQCGLCTASSGERLVSDLRRHLMRYLYAAIYLHDPACTPIMLDSNAVRQQILRQTSSWEPRARDTIMSYLLATLADLKGLAVICESSRDYAWSAVQLVELTKDMGMNRLTPPSHRYFLKWIDRSEELAEMSVDTMSEDCKSRLSVIHEYAERVGENGEFIGCTCGGDSGHTH